jgi:predicted permease
MGSIVYGLVPIGVTIALGWLIRRSGLVQAELWAGVTRLSYMALLPVLLFVTIARADLGEIEAGLFLTAAVGGFLAMAALAVALKPLLRTDDPTFTSVFQGAVRWNGFVILALAQAVLSTEQAALVAIVFGPTVPLINVMCVAALSVWGQHEGRVGFRRVFSRIVTNPLIIGCVAGALGNALPFLRPPLVIDTAELIGRAALPLILLTVGAGLDFKAIGAKPAMLTVAVALKLFIAPLTFFLIGNSLGLGTEILLVLTVIGAAPGAASSYVLARELGGNAELTAGHVTVTTILSFLTLPLWVAFLTG